MTTLELTAHLARQRAWSLETFGPSARTAGVLDHIRKELAEIEAAPGDVSEWIDVVILALDGALRQSTPERVVATLIAKQAKNEARQWPDWRTQSTDAAIEHVRATERLYISGPMAGYPGHNRQAFNVAEAELVAAGFDVLNPVNNGLPDGLDAVEYMRADLKMVCDSTGVAVLPRWEASWGARIEVDLAHRLNLPVRPLDVWLGAGS